MDDVKHLLDVSQLWSKTNTSYFFMAVCLVPVNWGLEAIKWKYLIKKTEIISFSMALRAVLSGVSISIFTPNRVGEFAGKVFFLKTTEKLKATLTSLTGSILQLLVTVLAGFIAMFIYFKTHTNTTLFQELFNLNRWAMLIVVLLLFAIVVVVVYWKIFKIEEYIVPFKRGELYYIFFLSIIRYAVFSFQYYFLLLMFNIDIGLLNSLVLIALTFLISAAIPSFALTEIAVRSASSIYFFSTVTSNTSDILSSSILLWMINLAIPALIGGLFIWQLNFFNE
jgi:hypothetical protein